MITRYLCVSGTWAVKRMKEDPLDWYRMKSKFASVVRDLVNWKRGRDAESKGGYKPWWSGDLEGSILVGDMPWKPSHDTWDHLAQKLSGFLAPLAGHTRRETAVVAHSHGGQGAIYALCHLRSLGRSRVGLLITVDTPMRPDMDDARKVAREAVRVWVHLHSGSGWGSRMRFLGLGFPRGLWPWGRKKCPEADINIRIPNHSDVLNQPARYIKIWNKALTAADRIEEYRKEAHAMSVASRAMARQGVEVGNKG